MEDAEARLTAEDTEAPVAAQGDGETAEAPAEAAVLTLDDMVAALSPPEAEAAPAEAASDAEAEAVESLAAGEARGTVGDEAGTAGDTTEAAAAPSLEEVPTDVATAGSVETEAAPAPIAEPADDASPAIVPIARRIWTRVPTWTVAFLFAAFVAAAVAYLWPAASGDFKSSAYYPLLIVGSVVFVIIHIVTGSTVWLSARAVAGKGARAGIAAMVWIRTLAWTAGGVALWWVGLVLLDLRHAGILG